MGLTPTQAALELAADAIRTFPAGPDEEFYRDAARAALLAFLLHMDACYSGDYYVEGSFCTIADLVREA